MRVYFVVRADRTHGAHHHAPPAHRRPLAHSVTSTAAVTASGSGSTDDAPLQLAGVQVPGAGAHPRRRQRVGVGELERALVALGGALLEQAGQLGLKALLLVGVDRQQAQVLDQLEPGGRAPG